MFWFLIKTFIFKNFVAFKSIWSFLKHIFEVKKLIKRGNNTMGKKSVKSSIQIMYQLYH